MSSAPRKVRDNAGALFKNKRKKKETHPDFQGECVIGGVEYYISGWARESAQGNRYTSLAFTPKAARAEYRPPRSSYPPTPPPATREQREERIPGSDDDQGDMPW